MFGRPIFFFLFAHDFEIVFKGWSSAMKALQYIIVFPFPHSERKTNVRSINVLVQCMCSSIVEVPLTCLVVDVNGLASLGLAIIIAIIHHTFYVRMYDEAGPVPPRNMRFLVGWGVVPLGDYRLCWVLPILERCSLLLIHIHEQIFNTFFTNLHPISFWLTHNLIIELNLVKLKMN